MEQNLHQALAIDALAAQCGLKATQFRRLFREQTGLSPVEYLTRLRVHRAQELLRDTNTSMTDIAHQLGFTTSQYFATTFRRTCGFTPRGYRQQYAAQQELGTTNAPIRS